MGLVSLLALLLVAACPRGFDAVENACVVIPPKATATLIYFHGMLPGTTDWSNVRELKLLGTEAKKRGVALIAPLGEQGLCPWATEHWCWPNDRSQLAHVERVVKRLPRVTGKPVLAGFSNGGYFVTLLATDSSIDAAAYVVMHAGPVTGSVFTPERARPTLLLGATHDVYQLPGMKRLAELLPEARFTIRNGVHEVTQEDVKALFDFVTSLSSRRGEGP